MFVQSIQNIKNGIRHHADIYDTIYKKQIRKSNSHSDTFQHDLYLQDRGKRIVKIRAGSVKRFYR